MGGLDILVNNAGLTRDGLSMRMSDADWEIVIKVNLEAAFRLSRAALRSMMRQRFGRIVGITSVVGVTGPVFPLWEDESMSWFPDEFSWIWGGTLWCDWHKGNEIRD